jgi:AcrR family transcriptional regulator
MESASPAAGTVDVRTGIRDAAVRLINTGGVAAATAPAICLEADIGVTEFGRHFATANDVFVDIARFMLAAYGAGIGGTLTRRRSLCESIRIAQLAFLEVVDHHPETQQALTVLRVAALGDPAVAVPAGATVSLHEEFITNAEMWLVEVGRVHEVTWELPLRLLATLMVGSMTGVVVDYLAQRNMAASREMVGVIAFDLARRARRTAKNRRP